MPAFLISEGCAMQTYTRLAGTTSQIVEARASRISSMRRLVDAVTEKLLIASLRTVFILRDYTIKHSLRYVSRAR